MWSSALTRKDQASGPGEPRKELLLEELDRSAIVEGGSADEKDCELFRLQPELRA
jgi:hypothetical protein